MRAVFGLVLVVGIGLAGFAVYMAKGVLQSYEAEANALRAAQSPAIQTVDVYVAARPLAYGQRLTKEDVTLVKFPAASLPDGVFSTEEALMPKGESEPRTVIRAMEKFEAILEVKVTGPGEDAGLTNQLERGMRAFAINVDTASGVAGFLRPGDRVDIYWTGNIGRSGVRTEGQSEGDVTKLIETGMKLIAVDQTSDGSTTGAILARTVTVAASPQQVAALAQAQSTGKLTLSLVGAGDETVAEAIEVDQSSLLGLAQVEIEQEAPRIEEEVCTIRTRRGSEVIVSEIPCTN
ncbi:Flp pilus assembly protein CpaB [Roseovarius sp. SCSIO 43702]|uniref:Flp pilus assembly protein CpaB n=1 Tax=Roseovarius sp. SCSIO 43702 TaxID=2823043 RepID=UPI001C73AC5C|nr:Flp pilus assembly protein CpaB [Roseovarius sp. SCSIO 43702]QYX57555.1 Flp pilus assembly protein CpaB [Roseovarius sp. SCSIO 43702]